VGGAADAKEVPLPLAQAESRNATAAIAGKSSGRMAEGIDPLVEFVKSACASGGCASSCGVVGVYEIGVSAFPCRRTAALA
jgi:hypothetical protein